MKKLQCLARLYPFKRCFSTVQVNHTPDPHNTTSHVFNFTPENEGKIEVLIRKYPSNYKRSAVIPMLFIAQEQNGNFLSLSAMNKVAEILEMPPIDVYEVASFYTMFNRTKVGRFHLQVCGTTPCMVRGAEKIISALQDHLHIKLGETTPDMMFTISEVECLGACVNAPMLQVNNQSVYEDLDEHNVIELIENFRSCKDVKVGPQNHRKNSEGPIGRTSLQDEHWLNQEHRLKRDFGSAKAEWEKAKEEAAKLAQAQAQAKVTPSTPNPPPSNHSPAQQTLDPKAPKPSSTAKFYEQESIVQNDTPKQSAQETQKPTQEEAKVSQKQVINDKEKLPTLTTDRTSANVEKSEVKGFEKSQNTPEVKSNKNVVQKGFSGKTPAKQDSSKAGGQKDKTKKIN